MNHTDKYIKRLIDSGLNSNYIAAHMSVPKERVENGRLGIWEDEPEQPAAAPKPRVPASKTFPTITDDMPDTERILLLTKHGLSVRKIQEHLSQPMNARAINRYVTKKLGPAPKGNLSKENAIQPAFMPYVVEALRRLGKNPYICELCDDPVPKGCIVHHTKYEGATVYDLMYICTSCNLSRANKGLS